MCQSDRDITANHENWLEAIIDEAVERSWCVGPCGCGQEDYRRALKKGLDCVLGRPNTYDPKRPETKWFSIEDARTLAEALSSLRGSAVRARYRGVPPSRRQVVVGFIIKVVWESDLDRKEILDILRYSPAARLQGFPAADLLDAMIDDGIVEGQKRPEEIMRAEQRSAHRENWLEAIIDEAVEKPGCVDFWCGACGSEDYRQALMNGVDCVLGRPHTDCLIFPLDRWFTTEVTRTLVKALSILRPPAISAHYGGVPPRRQQAINFVMQIVWGSDLHSKEIFRILGYSPAARLLRAMIEHDRQRTGR